MALKRSLTKKLQKFANRSRSGSLTQTGVCPQTPPLSESDMAQAGAADYFYSIPFEQTSPEQHISNNNSNNQLSSDNDASSIASSSNMESVASIREPVTPISEDANYNALIQTSQRLFAQNLTTSTYSNASSNTPVSTPGLTMSSNGNSPVSRDINGFNKGSFDSATSCLRATGSGNDVIMQMYPTNVGDYPINNFDSRKSVSADHQPKPSISSSCYSPPMSHSSPKPHNESFFIVEGDGSFVQCDSQLLKEDEIRTLEEDAKADEMAMHILEKVSADDYLRELRTGSWYI